MRATCTGVSTIVAILIGAGTAGAQSLTDGNPDDVKEVKAVTWTATAEAGLLLTTGNAKTTTATAAAKAQRVTAKDKLAAELGLAYARSSVLFAVDDDLVGTPGNGTIEEDEIGETTTTTANAWHAQVRYDRFLTNLNSVYVAALGSADQPAGKELVAGGQLGYTRHLIKKEAIALVVEGGYDFSYEDPVAGDGVAIHSVRGFVGYKGLIKQKSTLEASLEALGNLNTLSTPPEDAGPFDDTRVNALVALASKITEDISLSVSFGAKWDRHPSPRAPFALPYAAGFTPLADKLDTITKVSLLVTLF
jgi:hypothetical protein